MEQRLKKAMQDSISEVLGTMFYMPLEFDPEESLEGSGLFREARICAAKLDFKGPVSGSLLMLIPEKLLKTMTSDFMGSTEVGPEQMAGTLKEIVNMVAGNTFSIYDSSADFSLGIPEMLSSSSVTPHFFAGEGVFLLVESLEAPIGVWMEIRS